MSADYPEEEDLKRIKAWPPEDGWDKLMEFVRERWWPDPEYRFARHGDLHYVVSTSGWSGNEQIIGAMMDNTLFWMFCWESSQRGGHYVFKLPEKAGRAVPFCHWCDTQHTGERKGPDGRYCPGPLTERPEEWK